MSVFSYETRRDMIVTQAWERWTNNGLNLDEEDRRETIKSVQDAVNNSYIENISDNDWLTETFKRLFWFHSL